MTVGRNRALPAGFVPRTDAHAGTPLEAAAPLQTGAISTEES